MSRAKSPSAKNHRRTLKAAKGFKNARSRRIKVAKEAVLHAGQHAYIGRKEKKRTLRALWITRLNAAVREHDLSYSKFIDGLNKAKIQLDRKILSDIAVNDPETFSKIVSEIK